MTKNFLPLKRYVVQCLLKEENGLFLSIRCEKQEIKRPQLVEICTGFYPHAYVFIQNSSCHVNGWEYNAVPTMGDRPQEIINKQVLKNADLLVGIFWTRIGTPTGKAVSGSVEEIEKHIDSGKPAMLYFSNKPVAPASINQEQYQAVEKLKKEYQSKGLTGTFDTLEDFKTKFQRHLSIKLNDGTFFIGYKNKEIDETLSGFNNKIKLSNPLSNQARTLLIEAANDSDGQILRLDVIGGLEIQTNGKQFVKENDAKNKALWTSALDELENKGLIKALGHKRESFEVTHYRSS